VLVVLELNGGNDGLNTVVPFGDDLYRKHRPRLALAAGELHKLDDHVGLHPALREFKELYDGGSLAVMQSVGYLDDGDPRFAIDFRRVYATTLDRWLNCPSRVVLGEEFTPLEVL
jgi:uncharacterized protein (DUF1501 family)